MGYLFLLFIFFVGGGAVFFCGFVLFLGFFCMFQLTENYSVLYKNSLLMPFQSCLK